MPHTTVSHSQETTEWVPEAADQRLGNQGTKVIPLVLGTQKLENGTWNGAAGKPNISKYCLIATAESHRKVALTHFNLQVL